jgi:hypothetical protein
MLASDPILLNKTAVYGQTLRLASPGERTLPETQPLSMKTDALRSTVSGVSGPGNGNAKLAGMATKANDIVLHAIAMPFAGRARRGRHLAEWVVEEATGDSKGSAERDPENRRAGTGSLGSHAVASQPRGIVTLSRGSRGRSRSEMISGRNRGRLAPLLHGFRAE